MNSLANGSLVPVAGGVLVKNDEKIIGTVGVTVNSSENDEACATASIEHLGHS